MTSAKDDREPKLSGPGVSLTFGEELKVKKM